MRELFPDDTDEEDVRVRVGVLEVETLTVLVVLPFRGEVRAIE